VNTRQILYFAIGPIGNAAISFITIPILAWVFLPADIGRLTMLQTTVSFALLLFSLGLDQAYVREFHEVENRAALLKSVFIPGFLILILAIITSQFLPISLSVLLFDSNSVLLNYLIILGILLSFISRFLSLILRMQERGLAYSMGQIIPKLTFLLLVICYFCIGIEPFFEYLIIGNILSVSIMCTIIVFNTRSDWFPAIGEKINKYNLNKMIGYSLPLIGSGLAYWGLTTMDKIFLRKYSSFEDLGIYSVAISFSGIALVMQSIFTTIWVPLVNKWVAEGGNEIKITKVVDFVSFAIISLWALSGMFSWFVIYILPLEYTNVKNILLASMAYPLLYTLSESTGVGINITRKTIFSLLASIIALSVNALGNWFLIPIYGAAGAAIASAAAFFVFFFIRTEVSCNIWKSFERTRIYLFTGILVILSSVVNMVNFETYIVSMLYSLDKTSKTSSFNLNLIII
jgi:O-antigen/teichoic acid export membrane protein